MAYAVTRHLCLTLSLATLGTSPGWAQQPDTVTLTPIVVTATRVPLARDAVPAAVTVLSGADLRARGLTTVLEALRSVPAAQVVQTGSFGGQTSLFLRGGESDYVKVLLDGVPLNEPGGAFDFAHLTLDNVDRIEIVRGPASVLYGSDAVTGVVQIFTRRGAAGGASQLLGFEAGRYGTLRGRSELSAVTARGAAGATLGGSWLATDGLYPANSGYRNGVVSGRLRLTPDAASDAAVSIRYGDDVFHNPTNCFEQPTDTNKRQSGRGTTVGLDAGRFVTPRFETRLVLAYHAAETRFDDDPDGPSDPCFGYHSRDRVRRSLAGALAHVHLGRDAVVTGGIEAEWQRWRGTLSAERDNRAIYAQLVAGGGRRRPLSVTLGGRLDHNAQFGAKWTGRGGVAYRAGLTRVRAALGTGFKEPTFIENFATGYAVGDPGLKPERSLSWEMGVEQALAGVPASVSLTYFDQRFRDLIQYAPVPAPPDTDNFYNAGLAVARGVEVGVIARVVPALSASATYGYLFTREAQGTGRRLLRRPSHSGHLGLAYAAGTRGGVTLDAQFVGDRDDMDFATFTRVTLPPRTRVDAAARWTLTRRGPRSVLLTARVENLLDARYEDAKNYRTPRRSAFLGGEVRFRP